eukprot:CAMPEP_0185840612 /NCGR_PEP_ID=MMETSP1353-20130828/16502_1 /TAXON_ID=1077150 /ORGANISM="Erythrolobus australicus, Strain CCMP3124" /LENGTH=154 /DNA_ID=CAMNT_0028539959 /DNA_START=35 /DNA_END=496 /DNA_ORIENTATION=+
MTGASDDMRWHHSSAMDRALFEARVQRLWPVRTLEWNRPSTSSVVAVMPTERSREYDASIASKSASRHSAQHEESDALDGSAWWRGLNLSSEQLAALSSQVGIPNEEVHECLKLYRQAKRTASTIASPTAVPVKLSATPSADPAGHASSEPPES